MYYLYVPRKGGNTASYVDILFDLAVQGALKTLSRLKNDISGRIE